MSEIQSFQGIVLFRQEYREQDMIVKIFSREYGKQMFFVKNLQRTNHPLAGATLPFTRADFLGTMNPTGFSFIREVQQVQTSRLAHEQLEVQAVMAYMVQLVDAAMEDRMVNAALYDLLDESFQALERGVDAMIVMHFFELNSLVYFGVAFRWQQCLYCQEQQGPFDVSLAQAGLLCSKHVNEDPNRLHLNPRAVHIARQLMAISSALQIGTLKISPETASELKRFCDTLLDEFVGIRLKSKKFIDQMQKWQQNPFSKS